MANKSIVLDKNHMLAFLSKEPVRHFISGQALSIYLPFTEYVSLVKDLVYCGLDITHTPLGTYKFCLKDGDHSLKMHKVFCRDLAISGLNDLRFCHERGLPCTKIFGVFDSTVGNLIYHDVEYDMMMDFIIKNFSKEELQKAKTDESCLSTGIGSNVVKYRDPKLEDNAFMYYLYLSNICNFLGNKNFINIKE